MLYYNTRDDISLENLGRVNTNKVRLGNLRLWFSYSSIVAFSHPKTGLMCCQNEWSTTTGKLLNELEPDKSKRIGFDEFDKELSKLLKKVLK